MISLDKTISYQKQSHLVLKTRLYNIQKHITSYSKTYHLIIKTITILSSFQYYITLHLLSHLVLKTMSSDFTWQRYLYIHIHLYIYLTIIVSTLTIEYVFIWTYIHMLTIPLHSFLQSVFAHFQAFFVLFCASILHIIHYFLHIMYIYSNLQFCICYPAFFNVFSPVSCNLNSNLQDCTYQLFAF